MVLQALTLVLLLQAPGDGWALAQVPDREVKTLYWELFDTSETWVSVIPSGPKDEPPLTRLILQAFFVGKSTAGPPSRVVLRALGLPMTIMRDYSLKLTVDDKAFDLAPACASPAGSGPPCQLLYPPGANSSANGVAVDLDPGLVERLAGAHAVTGTALGFPIVLSPDDLAALARFAETAHLKDASKSEGGGGGVRPQMAGTSS